MPFDAEIGRQLKFTAGDLEHNQQGELSAKQRRYLWMNGFITGIVGVVAGGILILLGILSPTWLGIMSMIGGGIIMILGLLFFKDMLSTRVVLSIERKIEKIEWVYNRGRFIVVEGHRFKVDYYVSFSPELMAKTWIFYYVQPDIVLSAEAKR